MIKNDRFFKIIKKYSLLEIFIKVIIRIHDFCYFSLRKFYIKIFGLKIKKNKFENFTTKSNFFFRVVIKI